MAQRTGTDGLLRPRATVASARVILALAAVAALALSGCGGDSGSESTSAPQTQSTSTAAAEEAPSSTQGGSKGKQGPSPALPKGEPESGPSQKLREEVTIEEMILSSPSIKPNPDSSYTLPATYTCEGRNTWPSLAWKGVPADTKELVLLVVNLGAVEEKIFFYWAVAGLDPELEGITEGELPEGAIVGENGFGEAKYNLCPAGGQPETFLFSVYAIPKAASPKEGFDPLELREAHLEKGGSVGLLGMSYQRGKG